EDALEADAGFCPSEWAARARVHPTSERDVVHGVGPADPELGRAVEPPRVAVGGTVEQHDRRACADLDAADGRGAPGQTEVGLHGALDAQRFFDERRDALTVGP